MSDIYVIAPKKKSKQLSNMVDAAIKNNSFEIINNNSTIPNLRGKKLIFAIELDSAGYCLPVAEIISKLYDSEHPSLSGSSAALLIHSNSELYTKSTAQNIIFLLNQLGCRFIGHPMVEATHSLSNFLTWQKTLNMPLEDICLEMCRKLGKRLIDDNPEPVKNPKILVLHSSSHKTSNTLMLWNMAKKHLTGFNIRELHVENGTVLDCKGCSFKTCIHYSKQNSCFYGGIMVDEILPAIEESDAVIWICPNYNDSISANLMAVINRMTALYRKISFYNKNLFAVIVSGNSGSDSIAKQLIGSLNINKGFRLPPNFAIMSTANDPGSIKKVNGIEKKAEEFAFNIRKQLKS